MAWQANTRTCVQHAAGNLWPPLGSPFEPMQVAALRVRARDQEHVLRGEEWAMTRGGTTTGALEL